MARAMLRLASGLDPNAPARLAQASRSAFRFGDYSARCCALRSRACCRSRSSCRAAITAATCRRGSPPSSPRATRCAEVIVLDDASTDDSVAVAERHGGRMGARHPWSNAAHALRLGVRAVAPGGRDGATGEWLWIAEADDLCEPALARAPGRRNWTGARPGPRLLRQPGDRRATAPPCGATTRAITAPRARSPDDAVFDGAAFLRSHHGGAEPDPERERRALAAQRAAGRAAPLRGETCSLAAWPAIGGSTPRCSCGRARRSPMWRAPLNHHRRHAHSVTARISDAAHAAEIARMHGVVARLTGTDPGCSRGNAARAAARYGRVATTGWLPAAGCCQIGVAAPSPVQ